MTRQTSCAGCGELIVWHERLCRWYHLLTSSRYCAGISGAEAEPDRSGVL